MPAAFLKLVKI